MTLQIRIGAVTLGIWLLSATAQAASSARHEPVDRTSVVITSPISRSATNARVLTVVVRYRLPELRSSRRSRTVAARLQLLADGRLVDSVLLPRRQSDGTHAFTIDLATRSEGAIRLQAVLSCTAGRGCDARSNEVHILFDRTPPAVTLSSPLEGQIASPSEIAVAGEVRDLSSSVTSVTVNGKPVSLRHGAFRANLRLAFAATTVTVIARDRSGNIAQLQRTVYQTPDASPAPFFRSLPPVVALVSQPLRHMSLVASSNPASVRFSLQHGPAGMEIDPLTGVTTWTPTIDQTGEQAVTVVAEDATGRVHQFFTISTMSAVGTAVSSIISASSGGTVIVRSEASGIDGLSISFPPGALEADTEVHIVEVASPSPGLAGRPRFYRRAFHFTPDLELTVPATITFPYRPAEFSTAAGLALEEFLGVYHLDPSSGQLEGIPGFAVDTTNKVVTGRVNQFSTYVLTNRAQLTEPPASLRCRSGQPSVEAPALLIHGFRGDASTWGNLHEVLDRLDPEGDHCVKAWRFVWDSVSVSFEESANLLAATIARIRQETGRPLVNLVAHSFGGILARTYLQSLALEQPMPFRGGVNRLMTLGTPHQGIGGPYSTMLANACAGNSSPNVWPTCHETNTGGAGNAEGQFLRRLNNALLPVLGSPSSPQYHFISGQLLVAGAGGLVTRPDDALITLAGADFCSANPVACATADLTQEVVPASAAASVGLCHTGALGPLCHSDSNVPMAAVAGKDHMLWDKICSFLVDDAEVCKPQLSLTVVPVSPLAGGVVTVDGGDLACDGSCSPRFAAGTRVHLSSTAAAGFEFVGWSGSCTGRDDCDLTMNDDHQVTAIFACVDASICAPSATLSVSVSNSTGGRVTSDAAHPGIDCGSDCTETFPAATTVTLTATPAPGYRVVWSGDCSGTSPSVDVLMSANRMCVATFSQTDLDLDLTISGATCEIIPYPPSPMNWTLNVTLRGTVVAASADTAENFGAAFFVCSGSPDCLGHPQLLERAQCGGWEESRIEFLSGCHANAGAPPVAAWEFQYFYGLFFPTVPESRKDRVITVRLIESFDQQRVLERVVQVRCQ